LKRRGKTLKNQAELSWETGPLLPRRMIMSDNSPERVK